MNHQSFEQIASNCDIIIPIYKMLKFQQQLRLAQVSATLRSVFETFIWPQKYRVLKLFEVDAGGHVVTNESDVNKLLLNSVALKEFLAFYAPNVHELITSDQGHIAKFKNLTTLTYYVDGRAIGGEFADRLTDLIDDLPDLESLHLICHTNGLAPAPELISSLFRRRNLKRLNWDFSSRNNSHDRLNYKDFFEIIFTMKLDNLELLNPVIPQDDGPYTKFSAVTSRDAPNAQQVKATFGLISQFLNELDAEDYFTDTEWPARANPVTLKELAIETTFDSRLWSSNFGLFLQILANLTMLKVKITNSVTDDMLAIIAQTCQKLEKLSIHDTTFTQIQSFALPKTVKELQVENCAGLSYKNLKQMLTQTSLTKFIARRCTWSPEECEDYRISPLLHTLELDGLDLCELDRNENLQNLLHRTGVNHDSVASCTHLEVLDAGSKPMQLNTLLRLRYLQKLTTSLDVADDVGSYITGLLRHPTLKELILNDASMVDARSLCHGLATNVNSLKLGLNILYSALDFWLDLFAQNAAMKLTINMPDNLDQVVLCLKKLIHHKSFPACLRTIAVMGFNINCNDMRMNLRRSLDKLYCPSLHGSHSNADRRGRNAFSSYDEIGVIMIHHPSSKRFRSSYRDQSHNSYRRHYNKHQIILCRNLGCDNGRKLLENGREMGSAFLSHGRTADSFYGW